MSVDSRLAGPMVESGCGEQSEAGRVSRERAVSESLRSVSADSDRVPGDGRADRQRWDLRVDVRELGAGS